MDLPETEERLLSLQAPVAVDAHYIKLTNIIAFWELEQNNTPYNGGLRIGPKYQITCNLSDLLHVFMFKFDNIVILMFSCKIRASED